MQSITNNKLQALKNLVASVDITRNRKDCRFILSKVLALAHDGVATEELLPGLLKHLSNPDPVSKKLALWLVAKHGSHADLLLAVNSLVKDCQDPSPMTRGVALRALTQLTQCDFVEYSIQATVRGLNDDSCYVRRVAVLGCAKLHRLQPECVHERGLVDVLYSLIRDPDPIVMINCLRSLDEILRHDGGVIINKNINNYLLNRLDGVPQGLVPDLIRFLAKYTPKSDEEVYDIMNVCDDYVNRGDASSVVQLVTYFLHLTRDLPGVKSQVLQRMKSPLILILASGNPEMTYVILDFIEKTYLPHSIAEIVPNYTAFTCKQKEPVYVKVKRLELLSELVTDSNIQEVLEDVHVTALSSNQSVAQCSINAFGKIATKKGQFLEPCIQKLTHLLSLDRAPVDACVFGVLSSLDLTALDTATLRAITEHACRSLLSGESRGAHTDLLWLVGEYGHHHAETAYALERYATEHGTGQGGGGGDDGAWQVTEQSLALVGAAIKLFLRRPAEGQYVAGVVLEEAYGCGDFLVRQAARYYYALLKADVKAAKHLLLGEG